MCRCSSFLTIVLAFPIFLFTPAWGQLTVTPTTTLVSQTSNNTSASNVFGTQSNGNLGAFNISKVDVHSLLYPGNSTKIFAHLVLWFGESNHMNVGYSSSDPQQVHRQITDMISRGIDGVVMVWYGPNNSIDKAALAVMKEAETHPGFTFALMVDHGAIEWDSCAGCAPQQALTEQMQYVEQTYFPSPAYLRLEGQPVVTNFDIDLFYQIDWNALSASLASDPKFLFQNNEGFTHTVTSGAYSWVMPTSTNFGIGYLSSFYSDGMSHFSLATFGAAYKGFNDSLASWGTNRIMNQQCGQTWLKTFSDINGFYNSTNQLPYMQLVTWNDYEEGTEIETGIDNCTSVSASLSGNSLQWNTTGAQSTLDHYIVYIGTDAQNLMPLLDAPVGTQAINLCSFNLTSAAYTFYVQAVGRPSFANHMSSALSYTPHCSTSPPSILLKVSPSSLIIPNGKAGTFHVSVASQAGSFNQSVTLSCSMVPAWMSCTFSPSSLTPGAGSVKSVLTISTKQTSSSLERSLRKSARFPLYACFLPLAFTVLIAGGVGQKQATRSILLSMVVTGALLLSSCGGTPAALVPAQRSSMAPPGSYTIVITGNSTSSQASANATVVVQ